MSEQNSSRRNFLKTLGLTSAVSIASGSLFAAINDSPEILKLNPEQKTFMISYGKWMDEFIEVIRIQKSEPGNLTNHAKMISLTEQADVWKPQLTSYMNDKTFVLIYHASTQRMTEEIEG